ncbi:hypothetical protein [Pontibacter kalidii]|uniref:hypothetical protein n=1 Tax=Pontibacter kalidii TaxID=2592049 RepID=UPI00224FA3CB|nr:hypothetical protein [Pontibacter kalidii]
MKYAFILVAVAGMLFSCSHSHRDQASHSKAHATLPALALNGGERWQADEPTNANLRQLQQLMEDYLNQPEADSIDAIHELGRSMQLGFQEVFKECRMQGAEHDMLHAYLMPMLKDVKALETDNPATALAARHRLAERLGEYQTYFK